MMEEKYARNHIQIVNSIKQSKKVTFCGFDTTSNSQLSDQQTHLRIGVKLSNPEAKVIYKNSPDKEQNINQVEIKLTWPHGIEPGKKVDWHQYDIEGKLWDFTSSVKNQYECQSCGAFAIIASMESNFIIQARQKMNNIDFIRYGYDVVKTVDLSEWQLYIDSLIKLKR